MNMSFPTRSQIPNNSAEAADIPTVDTEGGHSAPSSCSSSIMDIGDIVDDDSTYMDIGVIFADETAPDASSTGIEQLQDIEPPRPAVMIAATNDDEEKASKQQMRTDLEQIEDGNGPGGALHQDQCVSNESSLLKKIRNSLQNVTSDSGDSQDNVTTTPQTLFNHDIGGDEETAPTAAAVAADGNHITRTSSNNHIIPDIQAEAYLVTPPSEEGDIDAPLVIPTPILPWYRQTKTRMLFTLVLVLVVVSAIAVGVAVGVSLSSNSGEDGGTISDGPTGPPTVSLNV